MSASVTVESAQRDADTERDVFLAEVRERAQLVADYWRALGRADREKVVRNLADAIRTGPTAYARCAAQIQVIIRLPSEALDILEPLLDAHRVAA